MKFEPSVRNNKWKDISDRDWTDWRWQMRSALSSLSDFRECFDLVESEVGGFGEGAPEFKILTTPYYASLASSTEPRDPIRRIFMPLEQERRVGHQQQLDPLGEKKHQVAKRVIHRYTDRVLFWATDICSVYCRYCTRKHFTAKGHAALDSSEYEEALAYIRSHSEIREVILTGGDPLTLSDQQIEKILRDLRAIEHVEIIRIGSRMPVVNPFRITTELVQILKKYNPIYMMTHFNHPRELTLEATTALNLLVDHGIPVFNQMVLLNGVNNHAAIVRALSRRLLYNRVKPYYMFQCDPSMGTDHLRTSVEQSMQIQRELWGHMSGLAMPTLSLDIPDGGGKAYLVPDFQTRHEGRVREFRGWDGVESQYISPPDSELLIPLDAEQW